MSAKAGGRRRLRAHRCASAVPRSRALSDETGHPAFVKDISDPMEFARARFDVAHLLFAALDGARGLELAVGRLVHPGGDEVGRHLDMALKREMFAERERLVRAV